MHELWALRRRDRAGEKSAVSSLTDSKEEKSKDAYLAFVIKSRVDQMLNVSGERRTLTGLRMSRYRQVQDSSVSNVQSWFS
jgi:hypothetical protein